MLGRRGPLHPRGRAYRGRHSRPRGHFIDPVSVPVPEANLEFTPAAVRGQVRTWVSRESYRLSDCQSGWSPWRGWARDYSLSIGADGKVLDVDLGEGEPNDPAVSRCVERLLRSWTMPPAGAGQQYEVLVYWELRRG